MIKACSRHLGHMQVQIYHPEEDAIYYIKSEQNAATALKVKQLK